MNTPKNATPAISGIGSAAGSSAYQNVSLSALDIRNTLQIPVNYSIQNVSEGNFSHGLEASTGFVSLYSVLYNSTIRINSTSPYPQYISSTIVITANSEVSNQTEYGTILTGAGFNNINSQNTADKNVTIANYSYLNNTYKIYNVFQDAIFNYSPSSRASWIPFYQYTAVFSRGNIVGFVSATSNENINPNFSIELSKVLLSKTLSTVK